jgi:hypothetical protein
MPRLIRGAARASFTSRSAVKRHGSQRRLKIPDAQSVGATPTTIRKDKKRLGKIQNVQDILVVRLRVVANERS